MPISAYYLLVALLRLDPVPTTSPTYARGKPEMYHNDSHVIVGVDIQTTTKTIVLTEKGRGYYHNNNQWM